APESPSAAPVPRGGLPVPREALAGRASWTHPSDAPLPGQHPAAETTFVPSSSDPYTPSGYERSEGADHRRLRFRWRRGYPGGSQDLLGPPGVRDERDHRRHRPDT